MTSSSEGNDGTGKGGAKKLKRRAARSKSPAESSETPVTTAAAQADATPVDGGAHTRGIAISAIAISVVSLLVTIGAVLWDTSRPSKEQFDNHMLAIGVAELRTALGGPAQYEDAIKLLYKLAPADEQVRAVLEPIEPAASAGIPTTNLLSRQLNHVAVEILVAETVPTSSNRWIDRALVNLASAVQLQSMVRQIDGHGQASETALRAQALMRLGNLEGAVAEVETLSERAAQIAAPWLAGARNRLAAMQALEALDDLIEKRLSFARP